MPTPSLREYLQVQIDAVEKRLCQKITAQAQAVVQAQAASGQAILKAEESMTARLELLNESRAALKDMLAITITRTEYAIAHRELANRIEIIERTLAKVAGQQSVWIALGTAGVAVLLGLIDIFLRIGSR